MTRRKRRTSAVLSSRSPKSPRVRQGSFVATDDGPHNGAASTQAHHPPPQPPRTPQREDRSISPVAGEDLRRNSPYPNANRDPVRHQPAVLGPVATATIFGPLRRALRLRLHRRRRLPQPGPLRRRPSPPPSHLRLDLEHAPHLPRAAAPPPLLLPRRGRLQCHLTQPPSFLFLGTPMQVPSGGGGGSSQPKPLCRFFASTLQLP